MPSEKPRTRAREPLTDEQKREGIAAYYEAVRFRDALSRDVDEARARVQRAKEQAGDEITPELEDALAAESTASEARRRVFQREPAPWWNRRWGPKPGEEP